MNAAPACYTAVVDLSGGASVTAVTGRGRLMGFYVNVTNSAAVVFKDGSTTLFTLPVTTAIGTYVPLPGLMFSSLVLTPGASQTGSISCFYTDA